MAAVAGVGVFSVKKTGFFGGQIEKFVRLNPKIWNKVEIQKNPKMGVEPKRFDIWRIVPEMLNAATAKIANNNQV